MSNKNCVILNCTEKKYICIDHEANNDCEFLSVGNIYREAIIDVLGNYNQIPQECILLLVHGQPFYVKKEYLSRFDKENDETRMIVSGSLIFLN